MTARDRCAWCDRPSREEHHLTGRDLDHDQFDPDLTVPLCVPHHQLAHARLRILHIDVAPASVADRLGAHAQRLARLAAFLGDHAERTGIVWWGRIADAVRSWADDLLDLHRLLQPT